jgi:hypothetical protein
VLLDECVPIQVASELDKFEVRTIRGMRWRGKKNGELLKLASEKFDVFVTIDRGLTSQQRLSAHRLGVITLVSRSNEIEALRPLMPALRQAVIKVKSGTSDPRKSVTHAISGKTNTAGTRRRRNPRASGGKLEDPRTV